MVKWFDPWVVNTWTSRAVNSAQGGF